MKRYEMSRWHAGFRQTNWREIVTAKEFVSQVGGIGLVDALDTGLCDLQPNST